MRRWTSREPKRGSSCHSGINNNLSFWWDNLTMFFFTWVMLFQIYLEGQELKLSVHIDKFQRERWNQDNVFFFSFFERGLRQEKFAKFQQARLTWWTDRWEEEQMMDSLFTITHQQASSCLVFFSLPSCRRRWRWRLMLRETMSWHCLSDISWDRVKFWVVIRAEAATWTISQGLVMYCIL